MKWTAIGTCKGLVAPALAAAVALVITGASATASAGGEKRYMFALQGVKASSDTPSRVVREIRSRLGSAVEDHERLLDELPDDAPDPNGDPEVFERYLRRNNLRAFKVHVELESYRAEVSERPEPDPGHVVTVHIGLRMFGEGFHKATMDFSGDGSATVQVPTGRRVRSRDRSHAHKTAIRMAVEEALATSLRELDGPKNR